MKHDLLSRAAGLLLCVLALTFAIPRTGFAITIAENTAGSMSSTAAGYFGQSFTTSSAGSFNNITFNFFAGFPGGTDPNGTANTPYALGTGFLFSSPYTGTPAGLSSATAGLLGQAVAAGGLYTFAAGLTLAPSTMYFFYENASIPRGAIFGGNLVKGSQFYFTPLSVGQYGPQGFSQDYRVAGNLAVPESGASALLLFIGLASLSVFSRTLVRPSARRSSI